MLDKILDYLKDKYQPDCIILHGSRARGAARKHSDWDFIFLYSGNNTNLDIISGRELFLQQNIEFQSVVLPVDDLIESFGTKLKSAKVLFQSTDEGSELLKEANKIYSDGVSWSNQKVANHKLWVQGRIDGMGDNLDNPLMFYKYFSDFYQRVFNYWYWVKKNKYSQPIYIALEEIEEEDKYYAELISQLVLDATSFEDKVIISGKIRDHLFQ